MSKYDGLIIPRSYSEYINKTDAATLQQALQQSGVLADAVESGNTKAVKSGAVKSAITESLGNIIDDTSTGTDKTWSASKTGSEIAGIIDDTSEDTSHAWSGEKTKTEIAGLIDDTSTATDKTLSASKINNTYKALKHITKSVSTNEYGILNLELANIIILHIDSNNSTYEITVPYESQAGNWYCQLYSYSGNRCTTSGISMNIDIYYYEL